MFYLKISRGEGGKANKAYDGHARHCYLQHDNYDNYCIHLAVAKALCAQNRKGKRKNPPPSPTESLSIIIVVCVTPLLTMCAWMMLCMGSDVHMGGQRQTQKKNLNY